MGELEVGHRRFGGGERAKEGRLGETGTRFLRGNFGSKLASMGGHSGEGLGGENRRAMAATIWSGSGSSFPEMAIGCLTPIDTSNEPETHQSSSRPLSCRGARWERVPRFY